MGSAAIVASGWAVTARWATGGLGGRACVGVERQLRHGHPQVRHEVAGQPPAQPDADLGKPRLPSGGAVILGEELTDEHRRVQVEWRPIERCRSFDLCR